MRALLILWLFLPASALAQDYNVPFVPRAAGGTPEDLSVNAVDATVNMVAANCTVARLDEGATPAGDWCTADTIGASELMVGFPTPSDAPTSGAGLQTCRFHIRKTNQSNALDWQIDVYDNGSVVASAIATGSTNSTTGVTVTGTWNANVLTNSDGSTAQCRIVQTGGHSGNPGNRVYLEVDTAQWNEQ